MCCGNHVLLDHPPSSDKSCFSMQSPFGFPLSPYKSLCFDIKTKMGDFVGVSLQQFPQVSFSLVRVRSTGRTWVNHLVDGGLWFSRFSKPDQLVPKRVECHLSQILPSITSRREKKRELLLHWSAFVENWKLIMKDSRRSSEERGILLIKQFLLSFLVWDCSQRPFFVNGKFYS